MIDISHDDESMHVQIYDKVVEQWIENVLMTVQE